MTAKLDLAHAARVAEERYNVINAEWDLVRGIAGYAIPQPLRRNTQVGVKRQLDCAYAKLDEARADLARSQANALAQSDDGGLIKRLLIIAVETAVGGKYASRWGWEVVTELERVQTRPPCGWAFELRRGLEKGFLSRLDRNIDGIYRRLSKGQLERVWEVLKGYCPERARDIQGNVYLGTPYKLTA